MYGRIAAINSLSDVYAMGGTPISALSIVCYPQKGDWDVLGEILAGGQEAMTEAGVVVIVLVFVAVIGYLVLPGIVRSMTGSGCV